MNGEKYSQRFRILAGDFYRLLVEYETLDKDADSMGVYHGLDNVVNDLNGLMKEINAEILGKLIDDEEVEQRIEITKG